MNGGTAVASPSNKKLLILYVLQVLRDYSSEAHPMRRQDIANKIEAVYGMTSERKAISTNLIALQDFDFDIVEISGKGVYLRSEFSAGELRLLGDYVLGSKYIPKEFARELAGKLRGLGKGAPSAQEIMPSRYPTSPDLFSSIEIFRKAIQRKKRVTFICNTFTRDKQMHPVSAEPILVDPYELVCHNGRYYLLGAHNEQLDHFPLDLLTAPKCTDLPRQDCASVTNQLVDIESYLASHPSMTPGTTIRITMRVKDDALGSLFETFGTRAEADKCDCVTVRTTEEDALRFGALHTNSVEILSPLSLRYKLRDTLEQAVCHYNGENERYRAALRGEQDDDNRLCTLRLESMHLESRTEFRKMPEVERAFFLETDLSDFNFLTDYPKLCDLTIYDSPLEDLAFVLKIPHLQRLNLWSTDVTSLEPLIYCPYLRVLCLQTNWEITDYARIADIPRLETLTITTECLEEIEKQISLAELYRRKPHLRINYAPPQHFENVSLIEFNDPERYIRPPFLPFPENLLQCMFGYGEKEVIAVRELLRDPSQNTAVRAEIEHVLGTLSPAIRPLGEARFKGCEPVLDAAYRLGIPFDDAVRRMVRFCRTFRHPKNSKHLIELIRPALDRTNR